MTSNTSLPSRDPLVSIALCTYNGERYIKEQIDTILAQTYQNFELIIVDDLSTDNTPAILNTYCQDSKVKVYYNSSNLGVIKNFEKAISLCKGAYISLSDQDDIWNINKLEVMLSKIGDNILLYHDSLVISELKELNFRMSDRLNFVRGKSALGLVFRNCIAGHAMVFKAELIPFLTSTPERIPHDHWIAYIAATVGKIDYIQDVLMQYRQHQSNVTDLFVLKKLPQKKRSWEEIKEEKFKKLTSFLPAFIQYKFIKPPQKKMLQTVYDKLLEREHRWYSFSLVWVLLNNLYLFSVINKTILGKIILSLKAGFHPSVSAWFHLNQKRLKRLAPALNNDLD